MEKQVVILRGLPGSGKSDLAWMLWKTMGATVCSADYYFYDGDEYVFDATKLGDAHAKCKEDFIHAIQNDEDVIVVDNTNTQQKEFEWYELTATHHGYTIRHLIVENRHGGVSSHKVPRETINKMRNRFEVQL